MLGHAAWIFLSPTLLPRPFPLPLQRAVCDALGVVLRVITSEPDHWYLTYEPHVGFTGSYIPTLAWVCLCVVTHGSLCTAGQAYTYAPLYRTLVRTCGMCLIMCSALQSCKACSQEINVHGNVHESRHQDVYLHVHLHVHLRLHVQPHLIFHVRVRVRVFMCVYVKERKSDREVFLTYIAPIHYNSIRYVLRPPTCMPELSKWHTPP